MTPMTSADDVGSCDTATPRSVTPMTSITPATMEIGLPPSCDLNSQSTETSTARLSPEAIRQKPAAHPYINNRMSAGGLGFRSDPRGRRNSHQPPCTTMKFPPSRNYVRSSPIHQSARGQPEPWRDPQFRQSARGQSEPWRDPQFRHAPKRLRNSQSETAGATPVELATARWVAWWARSMPSSE